MMPNPGGRFVLALDQGTTSSRAIVFDRQARPVATAQRELPQIYPQPGWVEHDPEQIWSTQLACAREALAQARLGAADLAAIGITNQRETTLLWERASGRPLGNAIVWQDRRTAEACARLRRAGREAEIRRRTGLVLDPYFSATKLAWLLDHLPQARARAERGELAFGTVDAWLVARLTDGAVHATDVSNASRTQLMDLQRLDWDDDLLEWFGIPRAVLPRIVASSGVLGNADPKWLGTAVAIAGIAGDQQAATFGQACFAPGMAKNTYGTGCFLLLQLGAHPRPPGHGLLGTVGWQLGAGPAADPTTRGGTASYLLEGSVFSGGAVVQWLRDGLGIIQDASQVEALAAQVPDSAGVVLVPAFTGLGAPYWDPDARGALLGLTRGSGRAHIARAALDSIALQSTELLQAMQADGCRLTELRVDGGAARNDLLMQLQADLLGVPVVRPRCTETTALGAAFLAGLAVGFWRDTAEIESLWHADRRFEPAWSAERREAMLHTWRRAVERSCRWIEADTPDPASQLPSPGGRGAGSQPPSPGGRGAGSRPPSPGGRGPGSPPPAPGGTGAGSPPPSPGGRGAGSLPPSPGGRGAGSPPPSPGGRGAGSLPPSPTGRGAGGEGNGGQSSIPGPSPLPPLPEGEGEVHAGNGPRPFPETS
jgi:glycerol kinase